MHGWPGFGEYLPGRLYDRISSTRNLNSTFWPWGATSASKGNFARTFKNFGYASGGSFADYYYVDVSQAIKGQGRPVIIFGSRTEIPTRSHYWVVDQIKAKRRKVTVIEDNVVKRTYWENDSEYIHVNWGWDGTSNGWYYPYYPSAFNTGNPESLDPGVGPSSEKRHYKYMLSMNTGIKWR